MKTTRTQVSKASKAIKAMIAAAFPEWRGRKVAVIEAAEGWEHTVFVDDQTDVAYYVLDEGRVAHQPRPRYTGGALTHKPQVGCVLMILSRFMGQDMGVEIIIPAGEDYRGAIDRAAVDVAVDALLGGDKRRAAKVLDETCGLSAGIAMALAEARAKRLGKAEQAVAS